MWHTKYNYKENRTHYIIYGELHINDTFNKLKLSVKTKGQTFIFYIDSEAANDNWIYLNMTIKFKKIINGNLRPYFMHFPKCVGSNIFFFPRPQTQHLLKFIPHHSIHYA